MNKSFFGFFVSLFIFFASANSFAALEWKDLVNKVQTQGQRTESYNGIYQTLSIVKSIGDSGAHEADYFSGVGGDDAAGNFKASHYETVSEQWNIDANGNWDIDQWLFKLDVSGRLVWVAHFHLIELPNGTVIEHRSVEVSQGEGAAKLHSTLSKF